MCLLVVLSRVVPGWPLIVAANRDEAYDRPADPLGVLREEPRTLGGRDRTAGGTWLAVNEHGVVAGLTNKPMLGAPPTGRTRGAIPLELTARATATASVSRFEAGHEPGTFNPCWVLAGDRDALHHLDLTGPDAPRARTLDPGIHVVENAPLDAPSTKAERVREQLGPLADLGEPHALLAGLMVILADHAITRPPDPGDPYGDLVSRASACCVHADGYGTRSAMIVRVPPGNRPPDVWSAEGAPCTHRFTQSSWPDAHRASGRLSSPRRRRP